MPESEKKSGRTAEQLAAELEERAKAAGALGRRLSHADQQLRNAAIVSGAQAGMKSPELAVRFGVDASVVRRIVRGEQRVPTRLDDKPIELVTEMVRGYQRTIASLDALALKYMDDRPSATIRAVLGAQETREKLVQLMMVVGKLPENLELFRGQAELEAIALQMLDKLDGARRGEVSVDELREFFSSLLGHDEPLPALPPVDAREAA